MTLKYQLGLNSLPGVRSWRWLVACGVLALAACGGGSKEPDTSSATPSSIPPTVPTVPTVSKPASREEAARFLTQATFGPTDADVDQVMAIGYEAWIDQQMAANPSEAHAATWDKANDGYKAAAAAASAASAAAPSKVAANTDDVLFSFWKHAVSAPDQLRHRVAFALSEIFVLSMMQDCAAGQPKGMAHYQDLLTQQAFGDYRTLLEDVARNPIMGCYLSHLKNQPEMASTGRVPDENFAREVMQLFTIGLYELKDDGTNQTGPNGPIDTYGPNDVSGLAKVFTGFSWDCPVFPSDSCFYGGSDNSSGTTQRYDDQFLLPMRGYPRFHSFSQKLFLTADIPAQVLNNATQSPDPAPEASLKVALDTLASHHNVAPFISKQLIQRLVTSNPSAEYVGRVTKAARTANGVNLGAMVKAILLDPEARGLDQVQSATFGKVREPVLRLSALLRAFEASSSTGNYMIGNTDNVSFGLGQSPWRSPSVFNFFRPGFAPPGSKVADAGLVAPELQLAHESSAQGYLRFMVDVLANDGAVGVTPAGATKRDVQMNFTLPGATGTDNIYVLASKSSAADLVDRLNQKLMYGTMSTGLKAEIKAAVETIAFKAKDATGAPAPTDAEIKNRLRAAIVLTVASPEFQVQK